MKRIILARLVLTRLVLTRMFLTRMFLTRLVLTGIVLACSINAHAAKSLADPAATKHLTDNFISMVAHGNIDTGYTMLNGYWAPPAADFKNLIQQSQAQRKQMGGRYGKVVGSEFVKTEFVGKSFLRQVYLEKFETHAVRWVFTFYKPHDEWLLNAVLWDDQVYSLFQPS